MKRVLLATLLVASIVSLCDARAAGVPVVEYEGAYRVVYFATNGPDARPISASEYESLRNGKACLGPPTVRHGSAAGVWRTERQIVIVCAM